MTPPTPFSTLLGQAKICDGFVRFVITDDWLQGRTSYGGLSAALALEAALRLEPELPPLRSAQVTFVGPCAGKVTVHHRVLRRGRSVTFLQVDVECQGTLATRCLFAFGSDRDSALDRAWVPMPDVPPPDDCEIYVVPPEAPSFTQHFDSRLARGGRPGTGSSERETLIWVRHRDVRCTGLGALIALADMPPPAALPMLRTMAPASSMTWLIHVADASPSNDGWHLLSTSAEHSRGGYSSQEMCAWSRDGRLLLGGGQSVAIFG